MATLRKRVSWLAPVLGGLVIVSGVWLGRELPPSAPTASAGPSRSSAREIVAAGAVAGRAEPRGQVEGLGRVGRADASGRAERPEPPAAPSIEPTEARLRELLRRDFEGLGETRRADGGYSLALRGRFRQVGAVVVGAEGAPVARCFCGADELVHALQASSHASTR